MGNDFRAAYVPGVSLHRLGTIRRRGGIRGRLSKRHHQLRSQAGFPRFVTLTNVLVDDASGIPDGNALKVTEV